jgi:transcriptional regulator with XRE-family HTH domain
MSKRKLPLRQLREQQGIAREKLAALVGSTATTLYRLETGMFGPRKDTRDKLDKWAESLGFSIQWDSRRTPPGARKTA